MTFLLCCCNIALMAQQPNRNGGQPMPKGRYYGKIVEDATGKAIAYASVQIWGQVRDTQTNEMKNTLLGGQLTSDNGEFSLENIPAFGEHQLIVSYLGFSDFEKKVSFELQRGTRPDLSKLDKDLGNIRLTLNENVLDEVIVTGEANTFSLALDKKVFKVDKNGIAAGGTAEDALRTMPAVSVDIDGNLSVRNAAPELFVDGRPTTLTIDQIPADAIDQIELITNPSAKFDAASGGSSGIINIVLKKDRRIGFNGSIRAGTDTNAGGNIGADINVREGDINAFVNANYMLRKSKGQGETTRKTITGSPLLDIKQTSSPNNEGYFLMGRAGVDWFINNRNTLTFSGNIHRGEFKPLDNIHTTTDTLYGTSSARSTALRQSSTRRSPNPYGLQLLYKYLFPKEGKEWTADLNMNTGVFEGDGDFTTTFTNPDIVTRQKQLVGSKSKFYVGQTDFVNPLPNKQKLEMGARAQYRIYDSENTISQFNFNDNEFVVVPQFANKYTYTDQVYAVYATYQKSYQKWGYQVGLRAESSQYAGKLPDVDSTFANSYPLALFPSMFVNYNLNEQDQLLLNYSRKINRPSFFQLLPYTDFTDSLLLSRGNPGLLPEFVNSIELSYQNIFNGNDNLLVSLYARQTTGLITRYQFQEYNYDLERDVLVSSYTNANSSFAYGVETNLRNTLFKIVEFNTNLNVYNATIDGTNVNQFLSRNQFTVFVKENASIKIKKVWTFQVTGEYQSRAAFLNDSGGGRGRGGFGGGGGGGAGFGGELNSTAQGYTLPFWSVDASIRRDIMNKAASITLSCQDIFRTRRRGTHSEGVFFVQDGWRIRDPQIFRLNFQWRFGKADTSLFKRRNNRSGGDSGIDMM
ncbi:MAG: TonB-dependent receptor [Saprospiraceae bacterium]|nr:TonB-dependent receptor [Saprospiraceae bacterium]